MSLALTGPLTGSRLVPGQSALPATFVDLPFAARAFFVLVMVAGGGALLLHPWASNSHWSVFLALLAGAAGAALFRVDLPSSPQGATMSLSFAFALAGLLLLGPQPTLVIAAVAAWVQCTVNVSSRTPLHRTAFSMAAAAVTAKASWLVFLGLGGNAAFSVPGLTGQEKAILGAAISYFVLSTLTTAVAVSLTSGQPLARVWNEHAVWGALSYIVGGGVAATGAVLLAGNGAWLTPLLVGPLYLTHRSYRVYSDRVEHERQRAGFQDIAPAHREIYALYEIARSMGTSLGVAETMALISSKLKSLVPFTTCALFLHEENGDLLRCRFATGVDAEILQPLAVKNGLGLVGWVGRNLRPLVNARPSADLEAAGAGGETTLQSALVCPLVFDDRLIGAIAVYDTEPGRFTDDHRRLLDCVAGQAAGVVNNSIVFEETKRDSLTDPLTGLPNTRFMFLHLARELARAERLKTEVSLLVMDLDGFKEINDMHGHNVGDKALREVARVLRSGIRPYDICVRYAGDEFVVVLSGCGAEEAQQKQRELQQAISDVPFEVRPGRFVQLGSSFGNAVFPRDGEAYETLLATADERMYQDKAQRKAQRPGQAAEPVEDRENRKPRSVFAKIPTQPPANRPH